MTKISKLFSCKINRNILIACLSLLNGFVVEKLYNTIGISADYYGTTIYGWNPISIGVFALSCLLLNLFLREEVLKNKGRVILSVLLGLLFSLSSILGTYTYYGNNRIFDTFEKTGSVLVLPLGLAIITIPLFSWLIGVVDQWEIGQTETAELSTKQKLTYFGLIAGLVLLSFMPLFFYCYPGNFVYDAGDQVYDYLADTMSTHNPILHTLLLGVVYKKGIDSGNLNAWFQIYTWVQMVSVAGAFAFFMTYLKERGVARKLRVILLLTFLLNPAVQYFSVTTVKGVIGTAGLMVAMTFLLRLCDKGLTKKAIGDIIGFILSVILSCHFRNNMIYAVAVGGLIIALMQKGWKKKALFLCIILACCVGFKVSHKGLAAVTRSSEVDSQRESMSVPLMCLARVVVNHGELLTEEELNEIYAYIPRESFDSYVFIIADGIKGNANEQLLRSNKVNFFKLVVKEGLRYPGDYIEAVVALIGGYIYPLNLPYYANGMTKVSLVGIRDGYPLIEYRNRDTIIDRFFQYMYGDADGRLSVPVLGWAFRSTLYVWGFFFATGYCIYRKNKRGIALLMLPFWYLVSTFLGPVSWLRYVAVNIFTLPMAIYAMIEKGKEDL